MERLILINHMGYRRTGGKEALYQGEEADAAGAFVLLNEDGAEVYRGTAVKKGPAADWETGYYWRLDFSDFAQAGRFRLRLDTAMGPVTSGVIELTEMLRDLRLISGLLNYFKAQRATGEWDAADAHLPFAGAREGVIDARGGWYDATGDYGIHLSHLSHSAYYNPQQAGLTAYTFFRTFELLERGGDPQYSLVKRRLLDEGVFGADFLMRRRAPSGTFFTRVVRSGDAMGRVTGTRRVGFEYRGGSLQFGPAGAVARETVTDNNYESSLRSGGGLAIAALAAAGVHYYPGGAFSREEYITAATEAWHFLSQANDRYTNDGQWNLLDEYCALTALVELYKATGEYEYQKSAGEMAKRLIDRLVPMDCGGENGRKSGGESSGEDMSGGMVWPEAAKGRLFHHASDEGMPVTALLAYADILPESAARRLAVTACEQMMRHKLSLSRQADNPFGYPAFLYGNQEQNRTRYFFPHDTAAAPWWQGENARLASLGTAAAALAVHTKDRKLAAALTAFAGRQINWILGLNPYNSSMMEGFGQNCTQYFFNGSYNFLNCPGGIVNGITSRAEDDAGIQFITRPTEAVNDNWRWAEQWLPHAAWMMQMLAWNGPIADVSLG